MAADTEEPTAYRVMSAFVNVKVPGVILPSAKGGGYTVMGYYKDAVLPQGAAPDDIKRLLAGGYIEAVPSE